SRHVSAYSLRRDPGQPALGPRHRRVGARAALAAAREHVLRDLLRDDGAARGPRHHRDEHPHVGSRQEHARSLLQGVLHAGRPRGALLAPRRPRVDLSLPPPLPRRKAGLTMATEPHSPAALSVDPHAGHGHGHDDHDDGGAVHVHIASTQFYVGIFAALVCLTILTVKVSYYDFGPA